MIQAEASPLKLLSAESVS